MTHPTDSASSGKPNKPDENFPLTPRTDGRWSKKIFGKVRTFTGTAEEARAKYEALIEGIGQETDGPPQIRHLCEAFMCSKQTDLDAEQITKRTFDDYHVVCDVVVAHFGRLRPLDDLTPKDAEALRTRLVKGVGLKTQSNRILRTRGIFKYGAETLLLNRPFHTWLKTVSRKKLRQYKQGRPSRLMTAEEIKTLLKAASPQLNAMILLGINCGFGNGDCADLTTRWLDLAGGWHSFPRPKTGENRRAKLWPETVLAIQSAMAKRSASRKIEDADKVFLTKYGTAWGKADRKTSPLSSEFRKLAKAAGIYRPGCSFYSLRHMAETIGGGSRDQVATNYLMGHVDASMAREYREMIEDDRLIAVADHIHKWLFGKPMREPGRRGLRIVG
jgi:integrase